MIDTARTEYVTAPDYTTGAALADEVENVVMVRTFSKMGIAGERVGWMYGPAHVVDAVHRLRGPFNVTLAGQAAAAAAARAAAEPLAAKPPMAAAEPLSLFLRVRFDGLLTVADSDMIVDGGTIDFVDNLSNNEPLSQMNYYVINKPHAGLAFRSLSSAIYDMKI